MSHIIEVLLADDHPVVRRGLKATIEEDADLRVIAEAVGRPRRVPSNRRVAASCCDSRY